MSKTFYVYILASRPYGYLYIGVTNNLVRRVYEHREELIPGHSQKYAIKNLVYYEASASIESAIKREKQLKRYTRQFKFGLINQDNPEWDDLFRSISR